MSIDTERLATDRAFWDSVAPEGATHWDTMVGVFCNTDGWWNDELFYRDKFQEEWGTDRYTPRPVEAWFPIVGERCQVIELPGIYIECEILANRCGDYIYYVPEKHAYGMLAAGAFRPIRTQAKTERTQLVTALNQLRGETDMGVIADSILELGFRITKP